MRSLKALFPLFFVFSTSLYVLACSSTPSSLQDTERPPVEVADQDDFLDAFEVNRLLGKGINLGNALEAPNEGEWGMVIEEEFISLIKEAGFESIRIPVRWNAHAQTASPYEISEPFFNRIDEVIQWALDRDLAVMINIHHYNELMENPQQHKQRFLRLWDQIATRYKDYPESLVFEILNEPHDNLTPDLWNNYLEEALQIIRESNPRRVVVIGTANWGGFGPLPDLVLPEDDRQLITTVHYYNPFQFTHQGASWVGPEADEWLGTTWNGSDEEKAQIDDDFDAVLEWAEANNRPIHLGEFGAYSTADDESRERWTSYVREAAEKREFSWAYWEFGAGFGVYDRDNQTWREGLLRALIPQSTQNSFRQFDDPPNIIWIMADDLGYGDLGSYGQEVIQTPRLDRMAGEGLRFTQFYSGHTVCAPARSSLMTGQHTGRTRIRGNFSAATGDRVPLEPEDTTVGEVLQQAGYQTALIGKWGLGEPGTTGVPQLKGFDYFWGFLNQRRAHTYHPEWVWRNNNRVILDQDENRMEYSTDFGVGSHDQYTHDLDMEETEWFIRANRERPFFLYLALQIPHAELIVPDDSLEDYLDDEGNSIFEEKPFDGSATYRPQEKPNATFAAMVTRMDRDIGRLLDLLEELDIDENTLVIFTSDNGPHAEGGYDPDYFNSGGPLRGIKRDLYEGGIRVPLIAWMPGTVPAGETSDQVWSMWDFLPTAAEIAGADTPEDIDGISMTNALLNLPQEDPEYLYWEFHEGVFRQAARFDDWKAVRTDYDQTIEIYDLSSDIGEEHDLAADHPDIVRQAEELFRTARTPTEHWPAPLDE